MAAQLSYASCGTYRSGTVDYEDLAADLANRLSARHIPACFVRREAREGLEFAERVAAQILRRGVLPVVELKQDDPSPPIRNLVETCALGVLRLDWMNGSPAFDVGNVLEVLNGAGRFRLPVDLLIHFGDSLPSQNDFAPFVDQLAEYTKKYGHVQVVKLGSMPADADETVVDEALGLVRSILNICPGSMGAVGPLLWVGSSSVRSLTGDLGLIEVDMEESTEQEYRSNDLKEASRVADRFGMPVMPRLPLTARFYRKGWYAFEVGKVLDGWVDRRAFRPYRERPGWLED